MSAEALKPFTSFRALVSFFVTWAIPMFAAASIYVLAAEDVLKRWDPGIAFVEASLTYGVTPGWLFVLVVTALSLMIGLNATPVYKFYEGIHWPKRIRLHREQVHAAHRQQLGVAAGASVEKDQPEGGKRRLRSSSSFGRLKALEDYPEQPFTPRATKLGNRLRAMETYSNKRFGLDLISFWYDLIAAANDEVRRNVEDARHTVEIYVAAAFVGMGLSILSLTTALGGLFLGGSIAPLLALGALSICVSWLAYERAVVEVTEWSLAVRALVHAGREDVAKSFGVALPKQLELERHFWEVLNGYLTYGSSAYQQELDYYRKQGHDQASNCSSSEATDGRKTRPASVCNALLPEAVAPRSTKRSLLRYLRKS